MPQANFARVSIIVVLALFLFAGSSLAAQELTWPGVGTQVRVVAPAAFGDTIHGLIWGFTPTAMVIETASGDRQSVSYDAVLQLDTAVYGAHGRSALYGAIAGAAFMPVFAFSFGGQAGDASLTEAAVSFAAIGAVFGGLAGYFYGLRSVREWSPVYINAARRGT